MAIISTAKRCKHISVVLFNVCSVFNRSRNIHVVRYSLAFIAFFFAEDNSTICILFYCLIHLEIFIHNKRYPDFLTQMQDYIDDSHTLCSIVGSGELIVKPHE